MSSHLTHMPHRPLVRNGRPRRIGHGALAISFVAFFAGPALSQDFVRVPPRQTHTDVKDGPTSNAVVLLLIPSGTELPIVKRQGEWLQVRLTPELRRVGIPMRWYKNEALGFVHESTVDVVAGTARSAVGGASTDPPAGQLPREYVRVPARQTNTDVKAAANSGSEVLLLVPTGTVLPVIGRQGEWIRVRLSPELRRLGTPMRWYKNEDSGFVHDSTVDMFTR